MTCAPGRAGKHQTVPRKLRSGSWGKPTSRAAEATLRVLGKWVRSMCASRKEMRYTLTIRSKKRQEGRSAGPYGRRQEDENLLAQNHVSSRPHATMEFVQQRPWREKL